MPRKTLIKVFAVLAVLVIAFASFTSLGGKDRVPTELSADEIKQIIADAIASTGAAGPADMGKVMGAIKPKIAGKADGALVSSLVKESLNK